ncbi:MAG: hypothetical protein AB1465_04465 [Patescibacteria group bacterium]
MIEKGEGGLSEEVLGANAESEVKSSAGQEVEPTKDKEPKCEKEKRDPTEVVSEFLIRFKRRIQEKEDEEAFSKIPIFSELTEEHFAPKMLRAIYREDELESLAEAVEAFLELETQIKPKASEIYQALAKSSAPSPFIDKLKDSLTYYAFDLGDITARKILRDILVIGVKMETERGDNLKDNTLRWTAWGLKEAQYFWAVQLDQKRDEEPERKELNIYGFDEVNEEGISGNERLREILRELNLDRLFSFYIREIGYTEDDEFPEAYGIKNAKSGGEYRRYGIVKLAATRKPTIFDVEILIHEWGHSIDPRLEGNSLPSISLLDQLNLFELWQRIRKEEPVEVTSYISRINNPDKETEDELERKEDWAESFMLFLTDPDFLKTKAPRRYEFCRAWFERFEPDFDYERFYAAYSKLLEKEYLKNEAYEKETNQNQE